MPRPSVEEVQSSSPASRWRQFDVPTPALVVDHRAFEKNMLEMVAVAQEYHVELAPHAKTHRIAELGLAQLELGADALCVAKLGEAERFADAGATKLVVAYPLAGREKAHRALNLHRNADVTFGVDGIEGARDFAEVFASEGESANLMLMVDSGLEREGVSFDNAPDVAKAIDELDGVRVLSIGTHEGTTYAATSPADLRHRSRRVAEQMVEVADAIRAHGVKLVHVSMGASASARIVAKVPGVTQIRPGIFAFNDVGQLGLGNATLATSAARVIATVTSHPESGRACLDAGSKALSSDLVPASASQETFPGHGYIVDHPGWIIDKVSEEHGWLRWVGSNPPTDLPVGTRVQILPNHVCMAFAMLRRAHIVRDGEAIAEWSTFSPGSSE